MDKYMKTKFQSVLKGQIGPTGLPSSNVKHVLEELKENNKELKTQL
jgi:hypothetical protein